VQQSVLSVTCAVYAVVSSCTRFSGASDNFIYFIHVKYFIAFLAHRCMLNSQQKAPNSSNI